MSRAGAAARLALVFAGTGAAVVAGGAVYKFARRVLGRGDEQAELRKAFAKPPPSESTTPPPVQAPPPPDVAPPFPAHEAASVAGWLDALELEGEEEEDDEP